MASGGPGWMKQIGSYWTWVSRRLVQRDLPRRKRLQVYLKDMDQQAQGTCPLSDDWDCPFMIFSNSSLGPKAGTYLQSISDQTRVQRKKGLRSQVSEETRDLGLG